MNSTQPMIKGASPTVYVTNLDTAVEFYTTSLGLKLMYKAPGQFAMIDAGEGSTIGLHPAGEHSPKPGTRGSIQLGLSVTQPIEDVIETLRSRGVAFRGPLLNDEPVKIAFFEDPDGNDLYLCEYQH